MVINGNSGCDLHLIDKGVIRKTSKSVEYNSRLEAQMKKQSEFNHNKIKTPRILNSGKENGLLYYDMEFINGQKFSDYIVNSSFDKTLSLFNEILLFIKSNDEGDSYDPSYYMMDKVSKLDKKLGIDTSIKKFVNDNMGGMSPIGTSHGDLTFENIIVFNDELYLIDFLDGYVQTPLVDISKLYQELYLNWSSRDSQSPFIVNVRNHQLKKVLDDFVIEMGYDKMTIRLHIVITMLRILPYAKNNSIYYRVLNKIFQIINL